MTTTDRPVGLDRRSEAAGGLIGATVGFALGGPIGAAAAGWLGARIGCHDDDQRLSDQASVEANKQRACELIQDWAVTKLRDGDWGPDDILGFSDDVPSLSEWAAKARMQPDEDKRTHAFLIRGKDGVVITVPFTHL